MKAKKTKVRTKGALSPRESLVKSLNTKISNIDRKMNVLSREFQEKKAVLIDKRNNFVYQLTNLK